MTAPKATIKSIATRILAIANQLFIGGVQVTATAAELNILDGVTATAAEINTAADKEAQTLTADGAITAKNGIVKLNKAGGFGNGGTGDSLEVEAHGGKWYLAGAHQVTIS